MNQKTPYSAQGYDLETRIKRYQNYVTHAKSGWIIVTADPTIEKDLLEFLPKEQHRQQLVSFWMYFIFFLLFCLLISFILFYTFAEQLVSYVAKPAFLLVLLLLVVFFGMDMSRYSLKQPIIRTEPVSPGVFVKKTRKKLVSRLIADMQKAAKKPKKS